MGSRGKGVPGGGHGELQAQGAACMILQKTSMEVSMACAEGIMG